MQSNGVQKDKLATVFWGQVAVALAILFAGVWVATQYCAAALRYGVGEPWFQAFGYPVYYPWEWFIWAFKYPVPPQILEVAHVIIIASFIVMITVQFAMVVRRNRRKKESTTYGSAKWATEDDLKENALLVNSGIVLAQTNDAVFEKKTVEGEKESFDLHWEMKKHGKRLIRSSGSEHVLCFAPTRSGKGVGLVIPTLLSWTGSTIVYDTKMELWTSTAGWRKRFSHCIRFFPTSETTACFNPLLEIRKGKREMQDAQAIADLLVDPDSTKDQRDHWEKTGRMFLVAVMLHVLYAEDDKSFRGVLAFMSDRRFKDDIRKMLKHMRDYPHSDGKPNPNIANYAQGMMYKVENELSGVISTAATFLEPFTSTYVAESTAHSDFTINDLMNAENPVSLYLVVPPSDIKITKPLLRIIFNLMTSRLMEKVDEGYGVKHKHRMLLMLDEFTMLGKMGFFETAMAFMAGYGIRCFLVAQNLEQIENVYGQNNSILGNCHARVTYGALDDYTAKRVSDLLGETTVERAQVNFSGGRFAPMRGHVMETIAESARALMTPGELLQLPGDDVILMVGGMSPYRGKKIKYYQDNRFSDRMSLKAPSSTKEQEQEVKPLQPRNNPWLLLHEKMRKEAVQAVGKEVQIAKVEAEEFLPNDEIWDETDFSHGKNKIPPAKDDAEGGNEVKGKSELEDLPI